MEVSLDNLRHNVHALRASMPAHARIIAVVKDSAYGCGAIPIARALEREGVGAFAVARICEARALRLAGITLPLLVLGECDTAELPWASDNDVHLTVNDPRHVRSWAASGLPLQLHCNIDTGMGRLGLRRDEVIPCLDQLDTTALRLTGVFTHLACADEPESTSITSQLSLFEATVNEIRARGIDPPFVHCGNSAGVLNCPWPPFATHARPGIALYGCLPDPERPFPVDVRPVVALKGHVVKVKRIAAGTPVSYGWRYVAPRNTTIATVDIGYGHGLPRFLSEKGSMLVNGRAFPIAGRVTMDFTMLDIGRADSEEVQPGDEVVAIGSQGSEMLSPDDIARIGGTIGYEVMCGLSTRVPRRYVESGTVVETHPAYCY